jgi:hypothetical protein
MTQTQWLLLPAFALVALTFVTVLRIAAGRVAAVQARKVRPAVVAEDSSKWPQELHRITNNYQNLLEMPVLYYAGLALLVSTGLTDAVAIVLSWAFVISRFVHSFVHTGSNHLLRRFLAFASGVITLIALWAWIGLRLYIIG